MPTIHLAADKTTDLKNDVLYSKFKPAELLDTIKTNPSICDNFTHTWIQHYCELHKIPAILPIMPRSSMTREKTATLIKGLAYFAKALDIRAHMESAGISHHQNANLERHALYPIYKKNLQKAVTHENYLSAYFLLQEAVTNELNDKDIASCIKFFPQLEEKFSILDNEPIYGLYLKAQLYLQFVNYINERKNSQSQGLSIFSKNSGSTDIASVVEKCTREARQNVEEMKGSLLLIDKFSEQSMVWVNGLDSRADEKSRTKFKDIVEDVQKALTRKPQLKR